MSLVSHEVKLSSFDEFEDRIRLIFEEYDSLRKKVKELKHYALLFRGHYDAAWNLSTTLERAGFEDMSFKDYVGKVESIRSKVETITNEHWKYSIEELKLAEEVTALDLMPSKKTIHLYEFFAYLRHHGFPSPLMDWTVSPYVAAFFAFDYMGKGDPLSGEAAIYCFIETRDGSKSGEEERGMIWSIGPNLVTHKRHYLQQCRYTVCLKRPLKHYCFGNHEKAIDPDNPEQDIVIKLILPLSIKQAVLKKLNLMNIGPYQLFEDEDSLVRSLAYESFM